MMRKGLLSLLAAASFAATGCSNGPQPIAIGRDQCAHCMMSVTDSRFAAQSITTKGKRLVFDSIECMVKASADPQLRDGFHWVHDYDNPSVMMPVDSARFVRSPEIKSPMGAGLAAFGPGSGTAESRFRRVEVKTWDEIKSVLERESVPRPSRPQATPLEPAPTGVIEVSPAGPVTSLARAVALSKSGQRIVVAPGVYYEPPVSVDKPLTIEGRAGAILDGGGSTQILTIAADQVVVRGLTFRNVGVSYMEDRAAIRVDGAHDCSIEDNTLLDTFFGIYVAESTGCVIRNNVIRGRADTESRSANGIHVWYSKSIAVESNVVSGHRDGIYFEFVEDAVVRDNVSRDNSRYGLHFMFSDRCRYERNLFRSNGAGVAVMYAKHVEMVDNRFESNWGSAAYGLLVKDITDSTIERNVVAGNTIGMYAEGANRLTIRQNVFDNNGWAVKVMANCVENAFIDNDFLGNTFDVATNGRSAHSYFRSNYWDRYEGYDLDRDGFGDVPFQPVRLFTLMVEQNEPAIILQHSLFVRILDTLERLIPSLTPDGLVDDQPRMRLRS